MDLHLAARRVAAGPGLSVDDLMGMLVAQIQAYDPVVDNFCSGRAPDAVARAEAALSARGVNRVLDLTGRDGLPACEDPKVFVDLLFMDGDKVLDLEFRDEDVPGFEDRVRSVFTAVLTALGDDAHTDGDPMTNPLQSPFLPSDPEIWLEWDGSAFVKGG